MPVRPTPTDSIDEYTDTDLDLPADEDLWRDHHDDPTDIEDGLAEWEAQAPEAPEASDERGHEVVYIEKPDEDGKGKTLPVIRPGQAKRWLTARPANLLVPDWQLRLPADHTSPTLVYGPSAAGKSWAALGLVAQIATNNIRCAVVATEGRYTWADRMLRYPADQQPLVIPDRLATPDFVNQAADIFDTENIGMVVVDTLRPLISRLAISENDSTAIDRVLDHLRPAIGGRAVVFVHHSGKDSTRKARGSSSLQDQAAAVFKVKDDPDGIAFVTCEKWRDGPLSDQPRLRLTFGPDGTIAATRTNVMTLSTPRDSSRHNVENYIQNNPGTTVTKIAKALDMPRPTVDSCVKKLVEDGKVRKAKQGREVGLYAIEGNPT